MYIDRLILLFVAGAFLLSPIVIDWWSADGSAWYRPFLIWALLILLALWIARSRDLNEL